MALAAWKRIEKTPGYQRKKLFLKRLIGRELRLTRDLEVAVEKAGGWWFHPQALGRTSVVYSLGVGEDIDFDLELIRRFGLSVHAFDPTPSTVTWLAERDVPENLHFHPWGIAAANGELTLYPRLKKDGSKSATMYTMVATGDTADDAVRVPAYNLQSVVAMLGHERIDVLKMDIEGAEYEVLDSLMSFALRPRQLLVEFHHRFSGIGAEKTEQMIGQLRECGYGIFAISETGREVSFIHREQEGPTS